MDFTQRGRFARLSAHLQHARLPRAPLLNLTPTETTAAAAMTLPDSVASYMYQLVSCGTMAGGAIGVARHGRLIAAGGFGTYLPTQDTLDGVHARVGSTAKLLRRVTSNTVFLVASLTKVVTATAVMMLIEAGKLELDQPLKSILSDCDRGLVGSITVRHLLTHTSGLPDGFPDNTALRRAGAPLSEFVARILAVAPEELLLFPPGTDIAYQSTGLCLLGAIVEQLSGLTLARFLATRVFNALEMKDTTLGEPAARESGAYGEKREAATVLTEQTDFMALNGVVAGVESDDTNWNWNSDYWRTLGAPWGGLVTSVIDMNRFCQLFVNGGVDVPSGTRLLSSATVELMTTPQTHLGNWMNGFPQPPALTGRSAGREGSSTQGRRKLRLSNGELAADRWPDAWGLGWRLNQAQKQFGTETPEHLFGHHGATGAMMWCDAKTGISCAVLTTQPALCYSHEFNVISNLVLQSFG